MSPFLSFAAFLALFIGKTVSQSVTLWEFGAGRLASGKTTLPLQPIGTPSDGLSTTYLYEVVNPVTNILTVNGSPDVTVSAVLSSRTIVASASGWVEHFGTTHEIQCNFFSSESASGVCFDETQTNSGAPTPVVLAVSTPVATSSEPAFTTTLVTQTVQTVNPTLSTAPTPTTTLVPSHSRTLSVGAIAGITIAGTVTVCVLAVLVMLWLFRRRERRSVEVDRAGMTDKTHGALSFPPTLMSSGPGHPYSSANSSADGSIFPKPFASA
ncbi:hypothetical protein C8R42DRAFT_722806 [Lentinula raphanica]|nr:hypothetical protein C8R42DRAFT_722806 [Lentinula raphanica]